MANLPTPTYNPQDADKSHGSILGFGTLRQSWSGPIDNRKAHADATQNGPSVGRFDKVYLPVTVGGRRFVVPVRPTSRDYADLVNAFGENSAEWVGKRIMVADSTTLKQVDVRPIDGAEPAQPVKRSK